MAIFKRPVLEKALARCVSADITRCSLHHPFAYKNFIAATNGHIMVAVAHTEAEDGTYLPLPHLLPTKLDSTPPDIGTLVDQESAKVAADLDACTVVRLPFAPVLALLQKFSEKQTDWVYLLRSQVLAPNETLRSGKHPLYRDELPEVAVNPRYLADVIACLSSEGVENFEAIIRGPIDAVFIRGVVTSPKVTYASAADKEACAVPEETSPLFVPTSSFGMIMPIRV